MSIDISGMLKYYRRKSMRGVMSDDNGRPMSDEEVRAELQRHLSLGHKIIPLCNDKDCPDFDYFGGGCPGHGIHYFDNDNREISKEEYERLQKGGAQ